MRIKRYRKKRDFPILILKVIFLISIVCLLINFFYNRIRPIVITAAKNQAKIIVINTLNNAIAEELGHNKIEYADIAQISYTSEGLISSIKTDTLTANTFKARIITVVLSELKNIETQDLKIPIGSLSDIPFFLGKGPYVNFKISSSGFADAEFKSEFFSAGINQTCHRIKLIVTAEIYALVPGFSSSSTITTDYYISETIIVGVTPDFFADIG